MALIDPVPAIVLARIRIAPPLPPAPADAHVDDAKPLSPPSALRVPLMVTVPLAAMRIAPPPPPPPPPAQFEPELRVDAPPPPPPPPMSGSRSDVAMNIPVVAVPAPVVPSTVAPAPPFGFPRNPAPPIAAKLIR